MQGCVGVKVGGEGIPEIEIVPMIFRRRFADVLTILVINPARVINVIVNIAIGDICKYLRWFVDQDHRGVSCNLIKVFYLI